MDLVQLHKIKQTLVIIQELVGKLGYLGRLVNLAILVFPRLPPNLFTEKSSVNLTLLRSTTNKLLTFFKVCAEQEGGMFG